MTQSSMRTPLGRVRGLGSAKSGTGHFWLQRMTAVSNLVLTIIFIGIVISLSGRPYPAAMALLGHPLVSILMLLFILSLGFYITPALLGGPRHRTIANLIDLQVHQMNDWTAASAMALVLLATTIAAVALLRWLVPERNLYGGAR